MKYGVLMGTLGLAQLYLASQSGWLAIWWAWSGVSFLIVAAGYASLGVRVFGKRLDGNLPWFHLVLLFPYLLITWVLWRLQVKLSREDSHNEVVPGLWVGRRAFAHEIPESARLIVDLTAEFPVPRGISQAREYICLPALDTSVPSASRLLEAVTNVQHRNDGIYIHCAAGHGRSAMFAAALLIARGAASSVEQAEGILKQARPGIDLCVSQRNLLNSILPELANLAKGNMERETEGAS